MASPLLFRGIRLHPFVLAVTCACSSIVQLAGQSSIPAGSSHRVPVLVELFTSEGCSDCPPADNLLQQLDAKQPIPGVEAIVLSEHVTYWNHDGWHDPFSLDAMTERQEDYDRRFGLQSSYTPQMVVDGTEQLVGNNPQALVAAVEKAAKTSKDPLAIENASWDQGSVVFSIHGDIPSHAKLYAALAADATHSDVTRGENAGRTLHHTAVVRVLKEYSAKDAAAASLKLLGGPLAQSGEATGPVRLVVFLVNPKTGQVLGAAEHTLQR